MTLGFKGKTVLERLNDKEYKLKSTLSFITEDTKYTIKPGLVSDGLSIPPLFWSVIGCPMAAKYIGSGLVHDGLYRSHAVPQKEADKLFKDMLKHNKVGTIRRNLMYIALRSFGWYSYNKKTPEQIKENKKYIAIERKS